VSDWSNLNQRKKDLMNSKIISRAACLTGGAWGMIPRSMLQLYSVNAETAPKTAEDKKRTTIRN
jgi:hypothetical protein